jgi:hypothetical protein
MREGEFNKARRNEPNYLGITDNRLYLATSCDRVKSFVCRKTRAARDSPTHTLYYDKKQ